MASSVQCIDIKLLHRVVMRLLEDCSSHQSCTGGVRAARTNEGSGAGSCGSGALPWRRRQRPLRVPCCSTLHQLSKLKTHCIQLGRLWCSSAQALTIPLSMFIVQPDQSLPKTLWILRSLNRRADVRVIRMYFAWESSQIFENALESALWSNCTFPILLLLQYTWSKRCKHATHFSTKKAIMLYVQCALAETVQGRCVLCWRPPFHRTAAISYKSWRVLHPPPNCRPPSAVWQHAVFKYPEKLGLHAVI